MSHFFRRKVFDGDDSSSSDGEDHHPPLHNRDPPDAHVGVPDAHMGMPGASPHMPGASPHIAGPPMPSVPSAHGPPMATARVPMALATTAPEVPVSVLGSGVPMASARIDSQMRYPGLASGVPMATSSSYYPPEAWASSVTTYNPARRNGQPYGGNDGLIGRPVFSSSPPRFESEQVQIDRFLAAGNTSSLLGPTPNRREPTTLAPWTPTVYGPGPRGLPNSPEGPEWNDPVYGSHGVHRPMGAESAPDMYMAYNNPLTSFGYKSGAGRMASTMR
mmetsp:Transcript_37861/g.85307  ORF Transcript_37861/g.85307 Transcript_37861/m.85307 type:complete len:275 (+) Transcript_37861:86-910(+)